MPSNYMETTHNTTVSGECSSCGKFLRAADHAVITYEPDELGNLTITGIEPACNDCIRQNSLDNVLTAKTPSEEVKIFSYVQALLDDSPDESYHNLPEVTVQAIIAELRLTTLSGSDQELADQVIEAADLVMTRERHDSNQN